MPDATPITIPLLNPNEPEAVLAALHVHAGQHVTAGQVLCTLETTKSTADLTAEGEGYIVGLRLEPGQTAQAGDLLCYLAPSPDWEPPVVQPATDSQPTDSALPGGLRITQPALALARSHNLDLSRLPLGPLVTEQMLRELVQAKVEEPGQTEAASPNQPPFDATAIVVYGGGGHGKSLIDLLRALGVYRIVGVLDDGLPSGETIMGLPLLGGGAVLPQLYAQGVRLAVNAVGGIGNVALRLKIFDRLAAAGFACPAVVHPTAFVEPSARLAPGVQVFPHAYVGSEAQVDFGAIINTGSIVSHDCILGRYANVSPGAMLAGNVTVGAGALIGMGVTVNLRVTIGAGARVGNGATVKADVPANAVVRAGAIFPA
jgi:sugar O-acyltransferase (sialic acid O-acetyltransferase NeuD family)